MPRREDTESNRRKRARRARLKPWREVSKRALRGDGLRPDSSAVLHDRQSINDIPRTAKTQSANTVPTVPMRRLSTALMLAIQRQPGLLLVTGESGVGKSVFAVYLANELRAAGYPVLVNGPSSLALNGQVDLLRAWHTSSNRIFGHVPPVLLSDGVDLSLLQALRDVMPLLDVDASDSLGIRAVLVGDPSIRMLFDAPAFEMLRRRIRFEDRLEPLAREDILQFIQSTAAGPVIITTDVLGAIAQESHGLPANVQFLWTQAQRFAEDDEERIPRTAHVEEAAAMLQPSASIGARVSNWLGLRWRPQRFRWRPERSERPAAQPSDVRKGAAGAAMMALIAVFWTFFLNEGTDRSPRDFKSQPVALQPVQNGASPENRALSGQQSSQTNATPQVATGVPTPPQQQANPTPNAAPQIGQPQPAAPNQVANAPMTPATREPPSSILNATPQVEQPQPAPPQIASGRGSPSQQQPNAQIANGERASAGQEQQAIRVIPPAPVPRPARPRQLARDAAAKPKAETSKEPVASRRPAITARSMPKPITPQPLVIPEPAPNRIAKASPLPGQPSVAQQSPVPKADSQMQVAGAASRRAAAQHCEPYISAVDFALHKGPVRGLACQDASGAWWLVTQEKE